MSDPTNTEPLKKCPICHAAHDPKPVIDVDLCYCPKCGVPRFYPAGGVQPLQLVECYQCRHIFQAKDSGGVTVLFRMWERVQEVETPKGLQQGLRLVRA